MSVLAASVFAGGLVASADRITPRAGNTAPTSAVCTPGFTPTLRSDAPGEQSVTLPYALDYDGGSPSNPAGQGSNPSAVGYTVTVSSPDGKETVNYGTSPTDVAQGVPWASTSGSFADGRVPAWALDASGSGEYRVTITYDKPVFGVRTAVTDLDVAGESMTLDAFAERTGGTAIPLTNHLLQSPSTLPELAPDQVHSGDDAYVVDADVVAGEGSNGYRNIRSGAVNNSSASVFFAFDSERPVQRIEMTYTTQSTAGFWFVPPSIPQACVQPNVSVSAAHQGGTATLTSTIANAAGNGRVEDIGYTYRLPEGVVVADPAQLVGGCDATVTAVPGSREIAVKGAAIGSGANSCVWSVDVLFVTGGLKTFDQSAIVDASGLNVEGTSAVTVDVATDEAGVDVSMDAAVVGGGAPALGKELTYTASVTNTGNAPLTTLTVEDDRGTGMRCSTLPLAVGATATCVSGKPYTITQADVEAGSVQNRATVTGTTGIGTVATAEAGPTTTTLDRTPALVGAVTDHLVVAGAAPAVGDAVTYVASFHNTGNVTLTDLQVDGKPADCAPASLAPGAVVECALPEHRLTQEDIDAGGVDRVFLLTAAGAGADGVRSEVSVTTPVATVVAGRLDVVSSLRTQDGERAEPGDSVVSTVSVTNTGNVTLHELALDVDRGSALGCPATVDPGQTVECETTAVLGQSDIDAGRLVVHVTGSAQPSTGARLELEPASDAVDLPVSAAAHVGLDTALVSGTDGRVDAGDTVTSTVTVTNTGNVTLSGVELTMSDGSALSCPADLAPGAVVECDSTLTLTQEMIDSGSVDLAVTGAATSPSGRAVPVEPARSTVVLPGVPAASLTLGAAAGDEVHHAGDRVRLTATVLNDGNVTLELGDFTLDGTEPLTCDGTVAPGASVECETVHELTQEDIDAGRYTAAVSGALTAPAGDSVQVGGSTAAELAAAPAVDLDLRAALDTGHDSRLAAGDLVRVRPVVTNSGNVTLHDAAVRGLETASTTCDVDLAPGGAVECDSVDHVLTQDDLDRGVLTITAEPVALTPSGDEVTAPEQTVSVALPADPALTVTADAVVRSTDRVLSAGEDGRVTVGVGDTVEWRSTVRNTGTVTIHDLRTVSAPDTGFRCDAEELAPGEETECVSVRHGITSADITHGSVSRTLHAEGTTGSSTTETDVTPLRVTSDERVVTVSIAAAVVPELAFTGTEIAGAAGLAILLLGGGGGLLLTSVRRRSERRRSS